MKQKFYIPLFLLAIIFSGFTQVKPPVKKIYGYKQANIPGILPVRIEEGDIEPKPRAIPKQNYNYWFYLELPKTEKITITGLWIGGMPHDIKNETVNQLPVKKFVFTDTGKNDTTIFVPFTKNKVLFIYPAGLSKDTVIRSGYIKELTNKNEIVIRYLWKNKTYYVSMKKLKEINPDIRV